MHADPFADRRSRMWYGENFAAVYREGTNQAMAGALKARGGEILAVGPVPCTDPQAPCLLKTCFDLFFKSLGWTCKFGGSKKGQYLWKW